MVSLVLFMSFARVLCNRCDARWISKTKSQNSRKRRNGGIINPLFDGLRYNTSGHFAPQLAKHPRVLYVKPSNNYITHTPFEIYQKTLGRIPLICASNHFLTHKKTCPR